MNIRKFYILLSVLLPVFTMAFTAEAQNTKTNYTPDIGGVDPTRPDYALVLNAKLIAKGEIISRGMVWRVFREAPASDGKLPLIASAQGGSATFNLNAGTYLVHASFGRAGASKRVIVSNGGVSEDFILQAGGLELNALAKDQIIPAKDLRFSIYELEQDEKGNRKLIALNVAANKIIQLNEGTYHVLSRYGTINATVRADLEVKAGEVTKALLQHRGAAVSLRLVSEIGGDPVANTAWAVFTKDGEKVFESRTVSPSFILSEGTYEAAVTNGDVNFKKTFTINPGKNTRVEILLK
ncbi:MAG: hypothetical protein V3V02_03910 [Rhizobiaceae bacterium]